MSPILNPGIPSIIVLILLAIYLYKNTNPKLTLFYFAAAIGYGILRRFVLNSLIREDFGPLFPYLMDSSVLRVGIVSLQEIVGWSVAALLAWLLADRLLRRMRIHPAPHRVALIGFFCMGAICWSVETAAIGAGWWTWTIKQPQHPIFGRVPLVGLLDWGFVAFDFLLPFLLFSTTSSISSRLISLTFFPLHFFFHPKSTVLPEPVPLTPNDLMHAGIFACVLARSLEDVSPPVLPEPSRDKLPWFPFIALLLVIGSAAVAEILVAQNPKLVLSSLPLLLLGIVAFAIPFGPKLELDRAKRKRVEKKSEWQALYWFGVFVAVFLVVYTLRAPFHRRTQQFVDHVNQGVKYWNHGDMKAAQKEINEALQIRPDQPSGHAILAQLLFQQHRLAEARKEAEIALDLNATQRDALLILATIDLREKKWNDALKRASYGISIYPDRPEFLYLRGMAEKNIPASQQKSAQSIQSAIDAARNAGLQARQGLARIAVVLQDSVTVQALQ
jgi:hypothetical protein